MGEEKRGQERERDRGGWMGGKGGKSRGEGRSRGGKRDGEGEGWREKKEKGERAATPHVCVSLSVAMTTLRRSLQ